MIFVPFWQYIYDVYTIPDDFEREKQFVVVNSRDFVSKR